MHFGLNQPIALYFFSTTPLGLLGILFITFCFGYILFRLQPRRFYVIRHGRTVLNDAGIKQGSEGGLSEPGVLQAQAVGKALAQVRHPRILAVCSSPFQRARETAQIVNSYLHVSISYTPLLAERRNPKEVIGKKADDPEVQRITGLIEKGFHEDDYRFSDEENFLDLSKRAKKCLKYLERRWSTQTCVVTHHAFLQIFLSFMLYRDELTAGNYAKLAFFNPADNAGITICEFHPLQKFTKSHGWKILTYNQVVEGA